MPGKTKRKPETKIDHHAFKSWARLRREPHEHGAVVSVARQVRTLPRDRPPAHVNHPKRLGASVDATEHPDRARPQRPDRACPRRPDRAYPRHGFRAELRGPAYQR